MRNHGLVPTPVVHDDDPSSRIRCPSVSLLLPRSTICDAMVRIMAAGRSPGNSRYPHHTGEPSSIQPSPIRWQSQQADGHGLLTEDAGDSRQIAFGEFSANVDDASWSSALAAEPGPRVIPLDSSTCMLWCAIALGALVRGQPLAHVGAFVPSISLALSFVFHHNAPCIDIHLPHKIGSATAGSFF